MTASSQREWIAAVPRDRRVIVLVTGTGTKMGANKALTARKGLVVVHNNDDEIRA